MSLSCWSLARYAGQAAQRPASVFLSPRVRRAIHLRPILRGPRYATPDNLYGCVSRRFSSNGIVGTAKDLTEQLEPPKQHFITPFPLNACPGCGAFAQTIEPGEAGYYSTKRKTVGSLKKGFDQTDQPKGQNSQHVLGRNEWQSPGYSVVDQTSADHLPIQDHPLCDRCHNLVHHHVGVPIAHPSVDSLADTIAESPHKYNHIYHLIDASDFPSSFIPKLHNALSISEQRSRNRRAKHFKFMAGKVTEVTFVITRSDLLAPKKEQVDGLMPYLVEVLRDALGSAGKNVRLGNVCCVSAKRGWWIRELKADIWRRGGGGWMVGKVNVGKSNLFEVVFPKGKVEEINLDSMRNKAHQQDKQRRSEILDRVEDARVSDELEQTEAQQQGKFEDENSLLPPARVETPYPIMPTISSLPGTTASPIRIPFGNGRGELIDLPGLARADLDTFVQSEYRDSLLMKSRITPAQYVIKPGSSLLLGGLIRITPVDPDIVILAYPFLNLHPHLTSIDKASAVQSGASQSGVRGLIATEAAQKCVASAGIFRLQWDVTRLRVGPLTASSAAGLKPKDLPFVVLSADILIDGLGWVELVVQVRKKKHDNSNGDSRIARHITEPLDFPAVEVFSPEGRFVSVRRPMSAWALGGLQTKPGRSTQKGRPRRSMRSARGSGERKSDADGESAR